MFITRTTVVLFVFVFSIHAKATRVKTTAHAFIKTTKEIRIIVFAARDLLGLTAKVSKTQYLRPKTPL